MSRARGLEYLSLPVGYYFATMKGVKRRLLVEVGYNGTTDDRETLAFLPGFAEAFPLCKFTDWRGPINEGEAKGIEPTILRKTIATEDRSEDWPAARTRRKTRRVDWIAVQARQDLERDD